MGQRVEYDGEINGRVEVLLYVHRKRLYQGEEEEEISPFIKYVTLKNADGYDGEINGHTHTHTSFTSTETVASLGTGAQDGHLDFHTAPELCEINPACPLPIQRNNSLRLLNATTPLRYNYV